MRIKTTLKVLKIVFVTCSLLAFFLVMGQAAENFPSPEALKPFEEARQRGDLQGLLSVFRQTGQANNKEAALTLLNAGLSSKILEGLSEEQIQQVLKTSQEVLTQMTDPEAWKVIFRATPEHSDWRVRAMLLDVVKTQVESEKNAKRAKRAIIGCLTDNVDAVALKAIDLTGDLKIKEAVPKLMRIVLAKWGQNVGLGAAKGAAALEKITGTSAPEGWYQWLNKNSQ
ncbi:MAG TPA: hypothetical protein VNM22_22040 [Candidatus Limnocylindrales bacterium]|nr:hypothetical protein [Candidatus Limnocylindrales bacterium]